MTSVSTIMTRSVRTMTPRDSLVQAAQAMSELDVGSLPVCLDGKLLGIVTDRDIVVRAVAQGAIDGNLERIMTREVEFCYEDQALDEVMARMRGARIRRLPVLDRQDKLVGIVSLGDVATNTDEADAGATLEAISEKAGS
ncbi:MAG: CBS domain-containing protein [Pseudomonadota bacterium]